MQKKLIAVAVAGLMSGAAFAQSNVTISGRVDVGYYASKVSGAGNAADTKSGIQSGIHDGSRIGFAGEEALGNGLKAIFMLEYGLANDANNGIGATNFASGNTSRQQWIGLTGSFGTVTAGQIYTPSDDIGAYDSMDQTAFSPRMVMLRDDRTGMWVDNTWSRWSNSVKYVSPTMGGFTVAGIYGFAPTYETDTTAYNANTGANQEQERGYGLGATYAAGPLSVSAYYDRVNDQNNAKADNSKSTRLGASYDLGVLALQGTYEQFKRTDADADPRNDSNKTKVWSIGTTVPMGNGLIRAQYSRLVGDFADNRDGDARGWGLGYDYNLSKRTMLYTGYTRVNSDDGVGYTYHRDRTTNIGAGGTYSGYGFGMLHKF